MAIFASDGAVSRRQATVCLLLIAASVLFLFARSYRYRHFQRDWVTVYAGGICLVEGCSPYSTDALDRVLQQRGEPPLDDWTPQLPIYPPPTMALFSPLAPLTVQHATGVMYWGSLAVALLCGFGAFVRSPMLADVSPVVRSLMFALMLGSPKMTWEFRYGNPVILVVPLLLFCCLDVAPGRRWLRAVLLALLCVLKPQIGMPFLLPMLLKRQDGWKTVITAVALLAAYTAAVLAWCTRHPATATWRTDLSAMLARGAAAGASMDPSDRVQLLNHLLDLQYMVGYWFESAAARAHVTVLLLAVVTALFVAAAVYAAVKAPGRWTYVLTVAATAGWTLLPVYHRFYDSVLLMLTLPCLAVALRERKHLGAAAVILLAYTLEFRQWLNNAHTLLQVHALPHPRSFGDFLLHRMNSIGMLLLTVLLTGALFLARESRAETAQN